MTSATIDPAALTALDRAAFDPAFWPQCLGEVGRAVGANLFALLRLEQAGADMIAPPDAQSHFENYLAGQWWERDLRGRRSMEAPAMTLVSDDTLVDPAEREGADFYRDFAALEDVPHVLAWRFEHQGRHFVFTNMRSAAQGPATARQRAAMAAIMARATSAAQISHAIASAREAGLIEGLDGAGAAVAALDHRGALVAATKAAEPLLRRHFSLDHGRLDVREPNAQAAVFNLREHLAGRGSADAPGEFVLAGAGAARGLHCTAIVNAGPGRDVFANVAALIVMRDLDACPAPAPPLLARLYGLTPAESEVAAQIAAGVSVKELSRARGVTTATTRTILSAVFRKTATSRQSELAALIVRLS